VIGVYDSGIGGLSILQALRRELPEQDFIYLADSGHGPYGERQTDHVVERARRITEHLRGRGVQALVVACNTATAAAIEHLRSEHPDLPIIGVEPALKPALALSRSRRIGVLATRMTLASDKFARLLEPLREQAQFVLRACDGLALAIENSVQGSA
jgi:glutamate racemase